VICAEIVPDGSHEHVSKSINFILQNQSKSCVTKCFYTDKAVADKNLHKLFNNFYKDTFNIEMETIVLQDIYHIKERIVRTLPKSHADYYIAVKKLTSIFSTLKIQDDKMTKEDFCNLLNKWEKEFSTCQIGKTSLENVSILGKILSEGKSDKEHKGKSIISSQTVSALDNVKQEPQLSSVWNIKQYSHLQQGIVLILFTFKITMYFITLHYLLFTGTSRNENFHRFINGKKPSFISVYSMYMLHIVLIFIIAAWNNR